MDEELERIKQEKKRRMLNMMNLNVIVYSTPSCPYCAMAKEYLKSMGIPFEDVDVSKDRARAMEMVQKSGQMGVPVIDINGTVIVGFNRPAIDMALRAALQ